MEGLSGLSAELKKSLGHESGDEEDAVGGQQLVMPSRAKKKRKKPMVVAEVKPAEVISKKKRKLLVKQKKDREKKQLRGGVLDQVTLPVDSLERSQMLPQYFLLPTITSL